MLFLPQTDIYLVEFLEALGIAFRLERDRIICNCCLQPYAIQYIAVSLEIETGVEDDVLVIAERDASSVAAIVLELVEIDEVARACIFFRPVDPEGIVRIDKADGFMTVPMGK